jgi:hypothetical protein
MDQRRRRKAQRTRNWHTSWRMRKKLRISNSKEIT